VPGGQSDCGLGRLARRRAPRSRLLQALAACEEASEGKEAELQGQLTQLQERREALQEAAGELQQVVAELQEHSAPLAAGGRRLACCT
jgi:chromosome segregation ATPase